MSRPRRTAPVRPGGTPGLGRVVPALAVLALVLVAAGPVGARPAGGPFYLVPTPTKECHNVKDCVGVVGPWVLVPAKGEATFLFGCPRRRGFKIGGTDARASSGAIRVSYEGVLGAPIGATASATRAGAVVLFHAVANNGRAGWFQPTVGCVSLKQQAKRSTVGALPGTTPSRPLDYRSESIALVLGAALSRGETALGCGRAERLVGSWHAFAIDAVSPPLSRYIDAVTIRTTESGNGVHATFRANRLFGPLAPQALAQVGAMCQP